MPKTVGHGGDSQYTPPWIFEALNIEFDLDVCAPPGGIPWIPAKNHYSEKEDGLTSEWYGRVWMNPPYSKPDPWMRKFIQHGNGVGLVCISKSNWFMDLWDSQVSFVFPLPNIGFIRPNLEIKQIFMPVILFGLGNECVQALKDSNIGKVR